MVRKVVLGFVILVIALVVVEAIALLRLKASISNYANYWRQPSSGAFTYVVLGDSAAQGIGASKPQYGYVGLLANRIQQETGQKVHIINLSVSGG